MPLHLVMVFVRLVKPPITQMATSSRSSSTVQVRVKSELQTHPTAENLGVVFTVDSGLMVLMPT